MKTRLILGLLLFAILGVVAYRLKPAPPATPPVYGDIGVFALVDQNGKGYSDERLRGSVVVVNFIFSSCPGVCPLLTQQMAKLQTQLGEKHLHTKLVSISVDPDRDTPDVLRAYGKKYGADFDRWTFLTGDLNSIRTVVVDSFKTMMGQEASGDDPDLFEIVHGENFVVLDRNSKIRAFQKVKNAQDIKKILHLVETLERENLS